MFDALRDRLRSLMDAPARARELAADRLTGRCKTGHVDATSEGLRVVVAVDPYVSPTWAGVIETSIADAFQEGKR